MNEQECCATFRTTQVGYLPHFQYSDKPSADQIQLPVSHRPELLATFIMIIHVERSSFQKLAGYRETSQTVYLLEKV